MYVDAAGSIIFDLDGTLIALRPPTEELEHLRRALLGIAETIGLTPSSHSIFSVYRELVAEKGISSAYAKQARDLLDAAEGQWAETATPLHAGWELPTLSRNGSLLGLVTSNGRRCVDALFANGKLPTEFTVIVTRDDVRLLKPAAEPLTRAVRALMSAGAAGPFLFVGDSSIDDAAAHSLNSELSGAVTFLRVGVDGCTLPQLVTALTAQTERKQSL